MNASRQAQYDANTSGSMYLSFDSSICSAAFKTLENTTNDHSLISNMDYEDSTPENSQGQNQDSTLEALDSHVDYMEASKETVNQQQSALPSRVLQQFNVVSSTPTKEQLLRSVEVVRGSSAERCMDLSRAFMDMEDKDKENTLPPSEVVKKAPVTATKEESLGKSENILNQKVSVITGAESDIKLKDGNVVSFTENKGAIVESQNKCGVPCSAAKAEYIKNKQMLETITENKELANPKTENIINPLSNDNKKVIGTITDNEESSKIDHIDIGHKRYGYDKKLISKDTKGSILKFAEDKATELVNTKNAVNMISVESVSLKGNDNIKTATNNHVKIDHTIAKNKRTSIASRPICEPDLLTNRPSRIATNTNKRVSVNYNGIKTNLEKEISTEIPKLMNKVLKIAESTTVVIDKTNTAVVFDKHNPISYNTKGRASILPSTALAQGEKRPFQYTQRMSVLVKTTLNSPARKIARRSCAIVGQQNWKSLAEKNLQSKSNRRSMLPVGKPTQTANEDTKPTLEAKTKTLTKTATSTTKPSSANIKPTTSITKAATSLPSNRKSVYPIEKPRNELQKPASVIPASNTKIRQSMAAGKLDTSFVCNVCGSKFTIKSLLDAHKRSHEGDGLPAFVKKPATATTTNAISTVSHGNNANKCKYCDKKFALLRALHIHLLQNCPKIPPNEKRKLKFHEMDHVEKAHLPTFFHGNTSQGKGTSHEQQVLATINTLQQQQRSASDLSSISVSSTDSLTAKGALAEITMIANNAAAAVDGMLPPDMAPPASRSVKKSTPHSGVHRTPNKSIICHTCKISFKTIMDHIQHNMTVHFNSSDAQKIAEIN